MKKSYIFFVCFLLTFTILKAQIVYKSLNDTVIGASNTDPVFFQADDHDPVNFGTMSLQFLGGIYPGFILFTPTAKEGTIANSYETIIPSLSHWKYPKAFSKDQCIGGLDNWTDLAYNNSAGELVYLYLDGLHSSVVSPKLSIDSSNQFVLLKFMSRTTTDSTMHYGWLRLTVNSANSITLHDWAYDESSVSPICAGYGLSCAPLTISNKIDSLNNGGTFAFDSSGREGINWTTSNNSLATISAQGELTAVDNGLVTVYAEIVNSPGMCPSVKDSFDVMIYTPGELNITATTDTVYIGSTLQLNALSGTSFSSQNGTLATVDGDGIVTGLALGTVDIYGENSGGASTLYDTFTVHVVCPDEIKINSASTTLDIFDSIQFSSSFTSVTWNVSNSNIATISASGMLNSIKEGNVQVYGTVTNSCGTFHDTINITIKCPAELIIDALTDTVKLGETLQLNTLGFDSSIVSWTIDAFAGGGNGTVTPNGVFTATNEGFVDVVASVDVCTSLSNYLTIFVDKADGIKEYSNNTFTMYPNPTNNIVNIVSEGYFNIQVYDVLGNKVYSEMSANKVLALNVSDYSKGIYFVRISNGKTNQTKQLIIK